MPLDKAATRGHAEAVDLLLQLHQQKRPTSTGAQVGMAQVGMEDGMVNVRNNFQETPLFKACLHARVDVVRTLVQVRHIIQDLIRDGAWYHVIHYQLTPRHILSVQYSCLVSFWQRYGADPSIRDVAQGRTPLEAVNGQGPEHEEIRRILAVRLTVHTVAELTMSAIP